MPGKRKLPIARTKELIVQRFDGEMLVYDLERLRAHCLNPAAALVWSACDGAATVEEVAGRLARDLGLPDDPALVQLALDQLDRAHLLEGRRRAARPSRRAVLARLGVAAAVVVALPAVLSIVTPTAAQNSSCIPPGHCSLATFGHCCNGISLLCCEVPPGSGNFRCVRTVACP